MTSELNHTLIWLIQTIFVGVLVIMLGAVFGIEFLFIEYGMDGRSLLQLFLYLLTITGSVFFLFWNVSKLIDEKMRELQFSAKKPGLDEQLE